MEKSGVIPERSAGVLLPVASLPGPYGIGTLGKAAREWIAFLSDAGQRYWQVLPLGPTGFGDDPYQSLSAFAGSSYYIDLDTLREEGLLRWEEYEDIHWAEGPGAVNYATLHARRQQVLHRAHTRFREADALEAFCRDNTPWLEDYVLFMAIKVKAGHHAWTEWEKPIRLRRPGALEDLRSALAAEMDYHRFVQYTFFKQWHALRTYAAEKGVRVIGDVPMYMAADSADVWANRRLFRLGGADEPPEAPTGPLHDWEWMAKDGYGWWVARLRAAAAQFDVVRIGHFCHFAGCGGRSGPGMALVEAVKAGVPGIRVIAGDVGGITDVARELLLYSGCPVAKVLQHPFDSRVSGGDAPHCYRPNCVAYTATHDTDTTLGWARNAPLQDVVRAMAYTGVSHRRDLPGAFIRLAMQGPARLAVVAMQDWLELGSEARVNTPGAVGANWRWRMAQSVLTGKLARRMRHLTELYGRI